MPQWFASLFQTPRLLPFVLAVVRLLPVLIVVVLSSPTWIVWVFLPKDRQPLVLEFVDKLTTWTFGRNYDLDEDVERRRQPRKRNPSRQLNRG